MCRIAVFAAAALCVAAPLATAQHALRPTGIYDPAVPTPRSVLGYEIGEAFTPHHMLMRYLDGLAATSRRVRLDTLARTYEGRELMLAIVTSEANQARIGQIRSDAARLADPAGASASELEAIVRRMPLIVWLGYTVHGGEASGLEAAIALLYQLAAGGDDETRMILDSSVVLIQPLQNPDGHERHVQDVLRARGAFDPNPNPAALIHASAWPGPRSNHYYFDLNRDWFAMAQPETRGRIAAFLRWWPHVAADLHETGSNSTYFFFPPMPPVNKNVPPGIPKWWEIFGAANAAAFDSNGWAYFRGEGYDMFYAGFGDSWPALNGAIGMTYEEATSSGGAIRRADGTILTLREAALHHYTSSWATLLVSARRARERVRDYLSYRQGSIADGERGVPRAVMIARDAQGRADSLALRLLDNGVAVQRLRMSADVRDAIEYGTTAPGIAHLDAGAYVVDFAQPQGRLAKALLEPDAQLDSAFIAEELANRRIGRSDRFYDVTAWSLPYLFRVRAWTLRAMPPGTENVTRASLATPPRAVALGDGRFGYAFEPGSEASIRLLAALFADSVRVMFAQRSFRAGETTFPRGALIVRTVGNPPDLRAIVQRHMTATGAHVTPLSTAAVDAGSDLGSGTVVPLERPNVAVLAGDPISGQSFGYTWYAFDQRIGYRVTPISVASAGGSALQDFNVLVIPSVTASALDAALGDAGRQHIASWVRDGGVLIALDGAMTWLAAERTGLARIRLRRDTVRADGAEGAPLPASVPGAIVRAIADTLSPLLAGVYDATLPVLYDSDRIFQVPRDVRPGEAVIRFAPLASLRLSGYLWPEMPARIAESDYAWTERVGSGRVIGLSGDPNFRDMYRGLLPIFANAVFLGGSY